MPCQEDTSVASSISITTITDNISQLTTSELTKTEPSIGNNTIQAKSIDNSRFEFPKTFPSVNTFSIDIDPFSSSSSRSSSTLSLNSKNPFDDLNILNKSSTVVKNNNKEIVDPFDIFDSQLKEEILLQDQNKNNKDPFSVFDSIFQNTRDQKLDEKMSTTTEQTDLDMNQQLNDELASDFANINTETTGDQITKIEEEEEEIEQEDLTTATGKFRSESVVSNEVRIKDPFIIQPDDQDSMNQPEPNQNTELDANNEDEDDNMDNVFSNYSNLTQNQVDDLPSLANELQNVDLTNTIVNQQDYNDQLDLAIRKGDTNLRSVELITKNDLVNNDDSSDDDFNYDFRKNQNYDNKNSNNNNNENNNVEQDFENNQNNENDRDLQDSLNDSIEGKFNIKSTEENDNINNDNDNDNNFNDQTTSLAAEDNNMVKFYSKSSFIKKNYIYIYIFKHS